MSRDFDSYPGISVNLSRDWTSLGWQVWICHKSSSYECESVKAASEMSVTLPMSVA